MINGLYESHNFKNINKAELKVFQNLHQQIKNDYEWIEFIKLFQIYFDGIIGIDQLFAIFDEKFSYKLTESLKEDIKVLLPSRDHSRRT